MPTFVDSTHLASRVRGDFVLLMTGDKKVKNAKYKYKHEAAAHVIAQYIPDEVIFSSILPRLNAAYQFLLLMHGHHNDDKAMIQALGNMGRKAMVRPGDFFPQAERAFVSLGKEHKLVLYVDIENNIWANQYLPDDVLARTITRVCVKRDAANLTVFCTELGLRRQNTVVVGSTPSEQMWAERNSLKFVAAHENFRDLPRLVTAALGPQKTPVQASFFS